MSINIPPKEVKKNYMRNIKLTEPRILVLNTLLNFVNGCRIAVNLSEIPPFRWAEGLNTEGDIWILKSSELTT